MKFLSLSGSTFKGGKEGEKCRRGSYPRIETFKHEVKVKEIEKRDKEVMMKMRVLLQGKKKRTWWQRLW